MPTTPLRIHPQNPKLFEFRGKPLVLVCATEHYGAVMNRPFDFAKYLDDCADKKQTLTRLFTLFRELQGPNNPYSTCKPETTDYIAPFRRVGPENAQDGGLKYDLSQWNDEFFERLHRFLSLASEREVCVEVVMLSNTYSDAVWAMNPLNPLNNVNEIKPSPMPVGDYNSLRHESNWKWQSAHVRKIVEETNRYDNIFYEICNEPGGPYPGAPQTAPNQEDINDWQRAIAKLIRETEARLPNKHLIAGQEAFTWHPVFVQTSDKTFADDFPMDIVNMHPLPDTEYRGVRYDMGSFMAKQLKLRAVRDYALATRNERKPLNYDEDNSSTQYRDPDGWTIHRKRAWTTLMCGAHYDMIDFSILPRLETGTPESQKHIRTWMKHLSEFIHSIDLARARPRVGSLTKQPPHTIESVLAVEGEDYCVYLADGRELGAGVGGEISGSIEFELPRGDFRAHLYSPTSGLYSPAIDVDGGARRQVHLPPFVHDVVVRFRRIASA